MHSIVVLALAVIAAAAPQRRNGGYNRGYGGSYNGGYNRGYGGSLAALVARFD